MSFGLFVWFYLFILRQVLITLNGGLPRCSAVWWDFCSRALLREALLFFGGYLLHSFFNLGFFDDVRCQYSKVLGIFLLSKLQYVPDLKVLFFQLSILSFFFVISMTYFSMLNYKPLSWVYILIVCIRSFNSFSFFLQIALCVP